ncbi:hypothetical protein MHTCC0001_08680 [Flavobacteriaceae bacterium MHTCC 0001]
MLFFKPICANAQTQIEVPLNIQVEKSNLIIEGRVVSKKSVWNAQHSGIFTINTIEVYKVFKGKQITKIDVITPGGTVGDITQSVYPSLKLNIDDIGLFTLHTNEERFNSNSNESFMLYSSAQGFYKYDLLENKAVNPFSIVKDITTSLYQSIEELTKSKYKIIGLFDVKAKVSKLSKNKALSAPSNITFSPSSIPAGAESVLTINGTGFGSVKGKVAFANADDGGFTFIDALDSQVFSWSDTEITVNVPERAGTGLIRVTDGNDDSEVSLDQLTITYALANNDNNGNGPDALMLQHFSSLSAPQNGDGSIVFQMNDGFDANTLAKASFLRAINTWRCETGINWVMGNATSVNTAAIDNVSVIRFGSLPDGVLGRCSTIVSSCNGTRDLAGEFDITFSDSVDITWYYGTGVTPGAEYDFESVAVHELGHAHLLGHVIDNNDIMHFTIGNGQFMRTLNSNNTEGAGAVQLLGTTSSVCNPTSAPLMTDYSGVDCPPLDVQDKSLEHSISFYPNPAKTELFIENNASLVLNSVALFDVSGRLILTYDISEAPKVKILDVSGMSSGVYFIKVASNTSSVTRKIVIE